MKDLTIILGSAGFVGRSLYEHFKSKKSDVIGIDFVGGEDFQIDFVKEFEKLKQIIEKFKPKSIVNLAALSNSNQCNKYKEKVYDLNVDFVEELAIFCESKKVKNFIHSSSEWVYGPGPINIQNNILPKDLYHKELDLYSRSKLDAELSLLRINRSKMNIYINRYGIIYGNEKIKSNCVVDFILKKYINNENIDLRSDQSGRSFISINDIVESLYINSINNKNFTNPLILNLQGPKCYQLRKIIEYLKNPKLLKIKDFIFTSDTNFDIKYIKSDVKKILNKDPLKLEDYLNKYRKKLI